MINDINLNQIRSEDTYNFKTIYEADDLEHEDTDSPYQHFYSDCDYYEPAQCRSKFAELENSTSYFHLNCRSLSSNWESFTDLLCELHSDKFTFDIIGVSEVFECDRDSRLNLPGFHNFIKRTRHDCKRGGIGLFVREDLHFKVREDLSVFIPHIFESLFIEIITSVKSSANKIVGVIYRPNTHPRADIDIFTETLYSIMDLINAEKKQSTIMGDLNIDLLKYNIHEQTKNYVDNVFSRGFVPLISKPTRVTTSSASLIDHMYTNSIPTTTITGIIINDVADHFGIFHIEKKKPTHKRKIIGKKRIFSEANLEIFKESLNQIDFTPIFLMDCPNEAYNKFIELYNISFNNSFPLKHFIPNKNYNKIEPWMSAGLLTSLRNKSKLLKKKLKHPTDQNIQKYKTYINCYNK